MKKTDLAHALAVTGRFAVKAAAGTMGVARCHLPERMKPQAKSFAAAVARLTMPGCCLRSAYWDCRATYGYRRICVKLIWQC